MTFEGVQMQGAPKIMEKISSLTFQRIAHSITAIDCQPMFDGGILINVLGQLKVILFPKVSNVVIKRNDNRYRIIL